MPPSLSHLAGAWPLGPPGLPGPGGRPPVPPRSPPWASTASPPPWRFAFRSTHKGQRASLSLGGGCPRRHAIKRETCTLDPGPGGGRQRRGPAPGTARDSREDRLFLCGWGESRHFSQFSCSVSGSLSHSQLSCFGLGRLLCGVRGGGGQGERGMEA